MAQSKAKKKLKHKLRNSKKLDPRDMRGSWGTVKPVTKVKESKRKDKEKCFLNE